MGAIKGVKRSNVVATKRKTPVGVFIALFVVIALIVEACAWLVAWEYYFKEREYNKFQIEAKQGEYIILSAISDLNQGDPLAGNVERKAISGNLLTSNALPVAASLSDLRASVPIKANEIITYSNSYDPVLADVVIDSTRTVRLDFLATPGIEVGDYIDIRIKAFFEGEDTLYKDNIVCSKKAVLFKSEEGDEIELMLTEADILNLNSAVVEVSNADIDIQNIGKMAQIYVTKYVNPSEQPKAVVNYDGSGITYTAEELEEAQNKLRELSAQRGY
jgi:hypothetical protein